MSSIAIDYIVYCRGFAECRFRGLAKTMEDSCDPFYSEDLALVVDPGDPDRFAVVSPVLFPQRLESSRSRGLRGTGSLHGLNTDSFGNRKPTVYLRVNAWVSSCSAKLIEVEGATKIGKAA